MIEDEEGMWDLVYAQLDNKISNASTRVRSTTMLTVGQQAKKENRIASKPITIK